MELIIIVFIALILGVLALAYNYTRKRGLSEHRKKFYRDKIEHASQLWDREAIVQCDKILAHILKDFGYSGTVADQLKENPYGISDIDEAWRLHKLRNRLVHEFDTPERNLGKEVERFQQLLLELVR